MTEIQEKILGVFKEISDLLETNGIPYFAIGGTCLGAVRHRGFIPWDDDLDIAIPIEYYEKFLEIARKDLPKHLRLFSPMDGKHNPLMFSKIMDKNTTMIENRFIHWRECYEGVWIDIMPMSGVPDKGMGREMFLLKRGWIERINVRIRSAYSDWKDSIRKLLYIIVYPLQILPTGYFQKIWFDTMKRYPFAESKYTGYTWEHSPLLKKRIFPKKWFEDYVYMDFEDTKIRCPIGWHEFLTQMFGDYMEYPPAEERTSGHQFDKGLVDLEHSYLDYQSGKLQIPKG